MKAQATTWIVAIVFSLLFVAGSPESLGQATDRDPLKIPDSDEGLPGAGPLRRSDWFRGVWRSRRGSWLKKTAAQKNSVVFLGDSITQGWRDDFGGALTRARWPTAASAGTPAGVSSCASRRTSSLSNRGPWSS